MSSQGWTLWKPGCSRGWSSSAAVEKGAAAAAGCTQSIGRTAGLLPAAAVAAAAAAAAAAGISHVDEAAADRVAGWASADTAAGSRTAAGANTHNRLQVQVTCAICREQPFACNTRGQSSADTLKLDLRVFMPVCVKCLIVHTTPLQDMQRSVGLRSPERGGKAIPTWGAGG